MLKRVADEITQELAQKTGVYNVQPKEWTRIAEEFNRLVGPESQRKPRQCRERWINVVDPGVKRGKWQLEEDLKILQLW